MIRHLGLGWVLTRLYLAIQRRLGVYRRRCLVRSFDSIISQVDLQNSTAQGNFFFSPESRPHWSARLKSFDPDRSALELADRILAGDFPYFGNRFAHLGATPDWFRNPFTGERAPHDRHWSQIGDFAHGDIKVIWEPSRFGWAFALVRAYWRSGDERYAERFWHLFEHWLESNPANLGANWMCGQETSLRLMAWCFAFYGFAGSAASTHDRERKLIAAVAVSAQRIEATLRYALSQRNNHGISEATALWTAGLLFPTLTEAPRWQRRGRRHLETQARQLIDDDGAFSQHSVNYQRVMLHDYLWAIRLGERNNAPLSPALCQRVTRAAELLYELQDDRTGRLPRYGNNDGALVLPLTNCDINDYRPVLQAARFTLAGRRVYASGPWDEELFWLCGTDALDAPVDPAERHDLEASAGGYYTLRSQSSAAFLRCGPFLHRPGHADQLHVDLWWNGTNIALDPGTYSYNAPAPWDLAGFDAAVHNGITVDGQEPMPRAGRFLYLPWERGTLRERRVSPGRNFASLYGERSGYKQLPSPVRHRRLVMRLCDDSWLVLDQLHSETPHHYRLHWLLADLGYTWDAECGHFGLATPAGDYHMHIGSTVKHMETALVRADEHSPRGWQFPHYLDRVPALSVTAEATASGLCFWSLFSPATIEASQVDRQRCFWNPAWALTLESDQQTVKCITAAGSDGDSLKVSLA